MRYKAKIADTVAIPKSQALVSVMIKGARAWQAGKGLDANLYDANKAPSFYSSWERGWKLANAGLITVKDSDTRDRRFCKEIIRF